MADARTLTPRTYSRNMYVPEENATFLAGQQGGENSYERFKRETVENTYNYVLQQTGSVEKAQDAAQSVARKMFRTELTAGVVAPEAAIAGVGRAVNLARSLLGGQRAETAASPALLTGPRNAMLPEEMLSPAPAAPSGPPRLTSGEFLPRIDVPRVQSSGITARDVVSSPFDDIGRMAGEGGMTDDAIAAARRMARERVAREEAFRARQLAEMEGEGGTAVNEAMRQRALRAAEDAGLTARQMSTAEGEGMLTADAVQAAKAMARRRLEAQEAAYQARLDRMTDDGAGMAMTRPMEKGVPPPGTGFTLGESSGAYSPNFTMPGAGRRQAGSFNMPAMRGGSDVLDLKPIGAAGSNMPAFLGALGGGSGTAAALYAARNLYGDGSGGASATGQGSAPGATRPNLFEETNMGAPRFTPEKRDIYEEFNQGAPQFAPEKRDIYEEFNQGAPRFARAPAASRAGASAPAAAAEPASIALWKEYNRSMMEDGGGRADLFERARRAEMEEQKGRARGGAANGGGKDAALHKALEIIHHMLVNR